jgi:protein-S-isoprenylcysteine O-methyltransferase Ste14
VALGLAFRSLFWTLVMPGVVAGYIPWRYYGVRDPGVTWSDPVDLGALVVSGTGVLLLAACILEFAKRGRGTLSPADPPKRLVVQGLYGYVRNPMYLGVMLMNRGEHVECCVR